MTTIILVTKVQPTVTLTLTRRHLEGRHMLTTEIIPRLTDREHMASEYADSFSLTGTVVAL